MHGVLSACSRHPLTLAAVCLALVLLLPIVGLVHHIYFDRRLLPDLEPFIRFEIDATGRIHDARGEVLVEVARENRRVVSYDEVPPVLRHAILAAEDKNFFSHSGVEYRALLSTGARKRGNLDQPSWRAEGRCQGGRFDVDRSSRRAKG